MKRRVGRRGVVRSIAHGGKDWQMWTYGEVEFGGVQAFGALLEFELESGGMNI